MAFKIGELFWKIKADTTDFNKDIKSSETKAKSFGSSLTAVGKAVAIGFSAAIVAGTVKISKELITAASNAEEVRNKFNVVFSDVRAEADAAAENLADNFGLSQAAAEDLLSSTSDLLTGFGFTQDSALALSDQVNQLAADLGSFQNVDTVTASEALTKALLGERESVKQLGISILDADVNAKVLKNTQEGLTFETERQAKAYATLQLAQEQSKNAIGDYARSQDSFANKLRESKASIDDLKVAMGDGLLPIATDSVSTFGELTQKLADFIAERNKLKSIKAGEVLGTADDYAKLIEKVEEEIDVLERSRVSNTFKQQKLQELRAEIQLYTDAMRNSALQEKYAKEASEERAESAALIAKEEAKRAEEKAAREEAAAEAEAERNQAILDGVAERQAARAEEESLEEKTVEALIARGERITAFEEEQATARIAIRDAELNATASIFGSLSSIYSNFADDSYAAAVAEKAFASAQAAINSYLAFTQVLASTTVPTLAKPAVAAAVLASGLAQQVSIISTPLPSFEQGGIVPGTSYTGDNVRANVNSGEMILNRSQQAKLFDMANSGGGSSQSINVYIGTKKIATELVDAINNGTGGTISKRIVK